MQLQVQGSIQPALACGQNLIFSMLFESPETFMEVLMFRKINIDPIFYTLLRCHPIFLSWRCYFSFDDPTN